MAKRVKQIGINLAPGGVSPTIVSGIHKAGVANILPLKDVNQHYTAFLVIDETDTDKLSQRRLPHADEPSI